MRHRHATKTLSRTAAGRRALARKLAIAFVTHGGVQTSPARAAFLRAFVEPLITTARKESLFSRRRVIAVLGNRDAADLLVKRAQAYGDRPGGYTRVTRLPNSRSGDRSRRVLISFV